MTYKNKILALALLGAFAGTAQAQSHLTVYGIMDTGFVKEGGNDTAMADNETASLGVRGYEDLGGGLKATFEIEKQFMAHDGTKQEYFLDDKIHQALGKRGMVDWQGAANIGFSGEWGDVRIGRISDIAVEYYSPFDPFEQGTTGSTLSKYSRLRSEQQSNTIRYDSPDWKGLAFSGSFTLQDDDHDRPYGDIYNYGFAGSLRYDNGPLQMAANYSRQADSGDSYVWNAGIAYKFGPARLSIGYQMSRLKDLKGLADPTVNPENPEDFESMKQREWMIGLTYEIGPGVFKLSYNRGKISDRERVDSERATGDANKYAIGYTYELSKRTSIYGVLSYTDSDNRHVAGVYHNNGAEKESVAGIQLGMTHHF
jgi:predicted porin